MAAALAVDARQRPCLAEGGAPRAAGRNGHAVGQLRQLDELAAVQRQLLDLPVVDDRGDFGIGGHEQRRFRDDGDLVRKLAELERDRDIDLLARVEHQPAPDEAPEAGQLDRQRVLPDRQRRHEEPAACVGDALEPGADGAVGNHDARARQQAALFVTHKT